MPTCILINAYGRRYLSIDAALKDWNAGKDFLILGGPYCSIRDIELLQKEYAAGMLYINGQSQYLWDTWRNM